MRVLVADVFPADGRFPAETAEEAAALAQQSTKLPDGAGRQTARQQVRRMARNQMVQEFLLVTGRRQRAERTESELLPAALDREGRGQLVMVGEVRLHLTPVLETRAHAHTAGDEPGAGTTTMYRRQGDWQRTLLDRLD